MIEVIGVRFKKAGKIYYFDPEELDIKKNDDVIVETARGIEYGKAVIGIKEINEEEIVSPLKNVIRIATEEDREKHKINKEKEKEAFDIFIEKIEKHSLIMKLIDVEYTFDNNKIIFYFTADGRVDFRELVKDLASVFRTRIELRQIGVRDEAKMISGLGPCGRPLCCSTFLGEFVPVSIKMAKEQNLSLNPSKISGICGRLMCCLTYEQESYEDVRERMPRVNSIVNTTFGKGTVVENNLLRETLKVKIPNTENEEIKLLKLEDVELVSGHYEGDKEYEEDIKKELKKELKNNENREALEELFKEN